MRRGLHQPDWSSDPQLTSAGVVIGPVNATHSNAPARIAFSVGVRRRELQRSLSHAKSPKPTRKNPRGWRPTLELLEELARRAGDVHAARNSALAVLHPLHNASRFGALPDNPCSCWYPLLSCGRRSWQSSPFCSLLLLPISCFSLAQCQPSRALFRDAIGPAINSRWDKTRRRIAAKILPLVYTSGHPTRLMQKTNGRQQASGLVALPSGIADGTSMPPRNRMHRGAARAIPGRWIARGQKIEFAGHAHRGGETTPAVPHP